MATPEQKQPSKQAEVWLVSDADHFRAMHDMIALIDPDGKTTIYECDDRGFQAEKPVRAVLAAAGFSGTHASPVKVRGHKGAAGGFVKHRGFRVSPDKLGEVEMMVKIALAGNLGGFTGVLMGQVGFHRSAFAFEYAWAAAGKPPLHVAQPPLCPSAEGDGAPGSIFERAAADPRVQSTLMLTGELPVPGELPTPEG